MEMLFILVLVQLNGQLCTPNLNMGALTIYIIRHADCIWEYNKQSWSLKTAM